MLRGRLETEAGDKGLKKLDLHVHTPNSVCYSDKPATPEQIVDAALAAGLTAIAVTDHNSVAGVDVMRKAGREKGLVVFPGVEVSSKEGHVLALFDLDVPKPRLEDLLDRIGLSHDGRGDAHTMAGSGMEGIFQQVDGLGGIAIAAHIERWPSGLLESKEPRTVKAQLIASEHLSALEITVPRNKRQWNEGKMWGYPSERACVQGSDAHSLAEIGRRPVFVRVDRVDLSALRLAFHDYETRVFFPDDLVSS